MALRSMERQIARHMMELAGIEQINKKKFERKKSEAKHHDGRVQPDDGKKASYFALHWKAYLDPESKERKALHAKLLREEELKRARDRSKNKRGYKRAPWPVRGAVKGG